MFLTIVEGYNSEAGFNPYTIYDNMVKQYLTTTSATHFVFLGHSAGAQFLQRWFIFSKVHDEHHHKVSYSLWLANPSSWVYFNQKRAVTLLF